MMAFKMIKQYLDFVWMTPWFIYLQETLCESIKKTHSYIAFITGYLTSLNSTFSIINIPIDLKFKGVKGAFSF